MTLLVLDTAGARCAALVRRGNGPDVVRAEDIGRGHDRRLAPIVRAVMAEAGAEMAALSRVGVVTGPGSFTGVRVGVAFARGLGLALRIPSVGVFALDALAAGLGRGLCAGVHDAKRGEVVWRAYRDAAPLGAAALMTVADARAALLEVAGEEGMRVAGSGAGLVAGGALADAGVAEASLSAIADLAERLDPALHPAAPYYHRPPDAKPADGGDPWTTPSDA